MNLQIIGFQNLLELTRDFVVVLKDHEFLSHDKSTTWLPTVDFTVRYICSLFYDPHIKYYLSNVVRFEL